MLVRIGRYSSSGFLTNVCYRNGMFTMYLLSFLYNSGGLLGETFILKQMLPLLKHVARSCIVVSSMNKPEPMHSWCSSALVDCLMTLDGLVAFLTREAIVKDLIEVCIWFSNHCFPVLYIQSWVVLLLNISPIVVQDQSCLHVLALMQTNLEITVLQVI